MKEFRFGIYLSEKGMEPFGSDELNNLIENGWVVKSISPSQAFLKENPEEHTAESESVTFAGYEMCAVLENEEFNELLKKAGALSEGLIRFDKTNRRKISFIEKNKLKQSIKLFDKALAIDPENAGALLLKAKCHESLNQNEDVLKSLESAFEIAPFNEIVCIEFGTILTKKGNFKRAIEVLEQGLQHHPEEPRILSNLGLSYLLAGQADPAISVYEKLVEIEPEYYLNPRFLSYAKSVANGVVGVPRSEKDISKHVLN